MTAKSIGDMIKEKMEGKYREILVNRIQTPDGTVLQSRHRHDYRTHTDSITGEEYMVDGGTDYQRTNINRIGATDLSLYEGAPIHEVRKYFCWGTYGIGGKGPLVWKVLKDLSDDHIASIIKYASPGAKVLAVLEQEVAYRRIAGIEVGEQ